MVNSNHIISAIKSLKERGPAATLKRTGQILKKDGIDELLVKIWKSSLPDKEILLLNKKRGCITADKCRYLYLRISSPTSSKIILSWKSGDRTYTTRAFDLYEPSATWMFDLALIKASDPSGRINYFWNAGITNFGIILDKESVIEWAKFTEVPISSTERHASSIEIIDYPKIAHIEITRKCNLKCYMCRYGREEEVKKIGTGDFDIELFDKMIPFMQNVPNIGLFGWGEPLYHPNFIDFIKAIPELKDRGKPHLSTKTRPFISFTTNATLLNHELLNLLIRNKLDGINVSIDSLDEKNFNFIRKGADFNKVVANLRMLQALKKQQGIFYPAITIQSVAMRRNIEELPDIVRFAADLEITQIRVTYITVSTKGLEEESLYHHKDLANRVFDEAQKLAKRRHINLYLPPRFDSEVEPQGYCDEVLDMFYARAEGTVIPCCRATEYVIGDLYKQTPEEIWKGQKRRALIGKLNKGILEGMCKDCYKFTGNDINLRDTHIKV